jgi:hypothetical protein
MPKVTTKIYFFFFCLLCGLGWSQSNALEISAEKEKAFIPYMYWRHGGVEGLDEFKKNHPYDYLKELWYYTSSFKVKRDHFAEGAVLDETIIDISRFESSRKEDEETILVMPGFRDALVLLAGNKLIYKPKER